MILEQKYTGHTSVPKLFEIDSPRIFLLMYFAITDVMVAGIVGLRENAQEMFFNS